LFKSPFFTTSPKGFSLTKGLHVTAKSRHPLEEEQLCLFNYLKRMDFRIRGNDTQVLSRLLQWRHFTKRFLFDAGSVIPAKTGIHPPGNLSFLQG
jgi:hypothetical protein